MRKIIFRGKSVKSGEWVTGHYCNCSLLDGDKNKTGHYIVEYPNKYHEVYTETIGEYIGLKDVNGNKIFEADIVKCYDIIGVVKIKNCFCIQWKNNFGGVSMMPLNGKNTLEIIGNIYDNPELLKGE